MADDVGVAALGLDLEPPLRWRVPPVHYRSHGDAPFAEPEGQGFLLAAIAGVALDVERHVFTIRHRPQQARFATGAAVGCNAAGITQRRLIRLRSGECR